jgi:hypothetical protein
MTARDAIGRQLTIISGRLLYLFLCFLLFVSVLYNCAKYDLEKTTYGMTALEVIGVVLFIAMQLEYLVCVQKTPFVDPAPEPHPEAEKHCEFCSQKFGLPLALCVKPENATHCRICDR